MRRKLKPRFLTAGICLAVMVTVGFIFICVLINRSADSEATQDQINTTAPESTVEPYADYNTEPDGTVAEPKSIEQIIIDEGLTVDEDGNVTDANGTQYTTEYGKIKFVYNGNLYTIDISKIKAVQERKNTVGTDNSKSNSTSSQSQQKQKTASNVSRNNQTVSRSSSSGKTENQSGISSRQNSSVYSGNQNQQSVPSAEKPTQAPIKPPTPQENEQSYDDKRLNYKSITIHTRDIISLTLYNADENVTWSVNSSILIPYSSNGNSQSYIAVTSGTAVVTASCGGKNYQCTVTIKNE